MLLSPRLYAIIRPRRRPHVDEAMLVSKLGQALVNAVFIDVTHFNELGGARLWVGIQGAAPHIELRIEGLKRVRTLLEGIPMRANRRNIVRCPPVE